MAKTMDDYWSQKNIRISAINPFAEKMLPLLQEGNRILDLGAGRGLDSLFFAEHGFAVTAVDIASENVDIINEKAKETGLSMHALQGDLSQPLAFPDSSFELIYAHLSIHYFDDATTRRLIAEIFRVLIPGGYFCVKCKSTADALYGQGEKVGEDMYRSDHIRHFFSKDYMTSLLAEWDLIALEESSSVYMDYRSAFVEAIARKPLH